MTTPVAVARDKAVMSDKIHNNRVQLVTTAAISKSNLIKFYYLDGIGGILGTVIIGIY